MKRVMMVGVSPGVGKSTFARKLGEALKIEVYHLDSFYWKPGWIEASLEDLDLISKTLLTMKHG